MELTNDILEQNGFTCNHENRVLRNYYLSNIDQNYHIVVEARFIPMTNTLSWDVAAWKMQDEVIIKKATATYIRTVEELQSVINLSNIDLLIYSK